MRADSAESNLKITPYQIRHKSSHLKEVQSQDRPRLSDTFERGTAGSLIEAFFLFAVFEPDRS